MGLKVQRKTTSVHKSAREAVTQHCMLLDQLRETAKVAPATGHGPFIGNISRAAICNAGKAGKMLVNQYEAMTIRLFYPNRRKPAFPDSYVGPCLGARRFARRTGNRRRRIRQIRDKVVGCGDSA